jgi:hypothetical protein
MVFNATFNNISVISWRSVLLVEETGIPRECWFRQLAIPESRVITTFLALKKRGSPGSEFIKKIPSIFFYSPEGGI